MFINCFLSRYQYTINQYYTMNYEYEFIINMVLKEVLYFNIYYMPICSTLTLIPFIITYKTSY